MINSVYQKLELTGNLHNLEKENYDNVRTLIDFRQKMMSKTQHCHNFRFWLEQRRRKHNVVTTLLQRFPTS